MRPHRTVFSTRRDSPRRVDARLRLRACRSRSRISETNRGSKCSITCCQGIQKSIMVECRERPPIIKKHTHSRFSKLFVQQRHHYRLHYYSSYGGGSSRISRNKFNRTAAALLVRMKTTTANSSVSTARNGKQ